MLSKTSCKRGVLHWRRPKELPSVKGLSHLIVYYWLSAPTARISYCSCSNLSARPAAFRKNADLPPPFLQCSKDRLIPFHQTSRDRKPKENCQYPDNQRCISAKRNTTGGDTGLRHCHFRTEIIMAIVIRGFTVGLVTRLLANTPSAFDTGWRPCRKSVQLQLQLRRHYDNLSGADFDSDAPAYKRAFCNNTCIIILSKLDKCSPCLPASIGDINLPLFSSRHQRYPTQTPQASWLGIVAQHCS